jgi:hypothetical protein
VHRSHVFLTIVICFISKTVLAQEKRPYLREDETTQAAAQLDSPSHPLVWTAPKGQSIHCEDQLIPYQFRGIIGSFDARDAFWMLWMGLRTHVHDEPSTVQEMKNIGFTRYQPLAHDRTSVQGFVASNGQVTVIAYRGSTDWIDWLTDLSFRTVDGRTFDMKGRIHAGFAKALDGVWLQVLSAIHAVGGENQPLWVTGHSLGGAMATLTAVRLGRLGYKLAPVYTFAAPRNGNDDYAQDSKEWLRGKHFRIINGQDLVPRLPPTVDGAADFAFILSPKLRDAVVKNLIGKLRYLHDGDILWFDDERKPWYLPDLDRTDDALFWRRIANIGRTQGLEHLIRIVAERQGDLHSEKTYACLLRDLYLQILRDPERAKIPVSLKGKIQTL